MRLISTFLLIVATACHGQSPPAIHHPQWLLFMAAQNTDGTNYTPSSNELVSPVGLESRLTCSNNLLPGWWTQLLYGRISHDYRSTNYWGTNQSVLFGHYTQPASILTIACGGVPFLTQTNPHGTHYYTARYTARAGLWDIADSTNLPVWRDAFAFVTATNGLLTISRQ